MTKNACKSFILPMLLLAGCGQDPVPAASPASPAPAAAAAQIPGLALAKDDTRTKVTSNGTAKCNIETLAGKNMEGEMLGVPASANTPVVGWYADVAGKNAGGDLKVVVHDQDQVQHWVGTISARTERTDVDAALAGGGALTASGFSLELDFSQLPAGFYGMYLEGSGGICGLGRTFEVR